VQRAKAEAKTAGGIFLPEAVVKDLNEAKVLAVGPGLLDRDGKRITPSVKPGDKVLIPQVCPMRPRLIDGMLMAVIVWRHRVEGWRKRLQLIPRLRDLGQAQ
jgi:co-chaperonin GroES (HSP10)